MLTEEVIASRELDAMVAEKVMGWHHYANETHPYWVAPTGAFFERYLPKFSTDIAAAWTVVEHFPSNEHWRFQLDTNQGDPWMAFFGRGALEGRWRETWAIGNADTAPLAICRAALKAVE